LDNMNHSAELKTNKCDFIHGKTFYKSIRSIKKRENVPYLRQRLRPVQVLIPLEK
jgi:hypothetical protein